MNLAFRMEVQTDADGAREIVSVECEPTNDEPSEDLAVEALAPGSWLFGFVLADDFDGNEDIFRAFRRYRLDPEEVQEACREAVEAAAA
jgi:hypothetical protein